MEKAISLAVQQAASQVKFAISVAHGSAVDRAEAVMNVIKERLPNASNFLMSDISPALSVHTGPGLSASRCRRCQCEHGERHSLYNPPGPQEDAAGLLAVFAPYVQEGTVSFEHEVPSEAAFREKIGHILADYPFFVAQVEGKVAGYCYASRFRGQAAL